MRKQSLHPSELPPEALPFVRDLLLEVTRHIPPSLGTPPRFGADDLSQPQGCMEAARTLIRWFETMPADLDHRMGEMEAVFASLLTVVHQVDSKIHRAVHHTREWVEDELSFSRSTHEVLQDLRRTIQAKATQVADAGELLNQLIRRFEVRSEDSFDVVEVSRQFDEIQRDLGRLRSEISQVEKRTRDLRDQSMRDGLTGLWNRRAYDERIAEELARSERYASPFSLALWDVDRFKRVNDSHGHRVGDVVLRSLAGRVSGMLRRSDFLARHGGEEFAVLLPNTNLAQAAQAGEKIRTLVGLEPVESPAGALSITVSIGVTGVAPADTAESIFARADRALYQAKRAGRNRVAQEEPPATVSRLANG